MEKAGRQALLFWPGSRSGGSGLALSSHGELLLCHSCGYRFSLILGLGSPSLAVRWLLRAGARACQFSKAETRGSECVTPAEN